MTTNEKNVLIAKTCGWTEGFPDRKGGILLPYKWENERTGERTMELPDYFDDLNAMHTAEETLTEEQGEEYMRFLKQEAFSPFSTLWDCAHATAAQRAEAFGRALKLWSRY